MRYSPLVVIIGLLGALLILSQSARGQADQPVYIPLVAIPSPMVSLTATATGGAGTPTTTRTATATGGAGTPTTTRTATATGGAGTPTTTRTATATSGAATSTATRTATATGVAGTPTASRTATATSGAATPTASRTATATPTLPPPSFVSCATPPANPGSAPNYPLLIVSIDKVAETVTLRNTTSSATVDLTGWQMCSITGGQSHPISGSLAPGETRTFINSGGLIWNNLASDPGALYDPAGRLISYFAD